MAMAWRLVGHDQPLASGAVYAIEMSQHAHLDRAISCELCRRRRRPAKPAENARMRRRYRRFLSLSSDANNLTPM